MSVNNYLVVQKMHRVAMKGLGAMKKEGRGINLENRILLKLKCTRDVVLPGVLVSNLLELLNLPVSINDSRNATL